MDRSILKGTINGDVDQGTCISSGGNHEPERWSKITAALGDIQK